MSNGNELLDTSKYNNFKTIFFEKIIEEVY